MVHQLAERQTATGMGQKAPVWKMSGSRGSTWTVRLALSSSCASITFHGEVRPPLLPPASAGKSTYNFFQPHIRHTCLEVQPVACMERISQLDELMIFGCSMINFPWGGEVRPKRPTVGHELKAPAGQSNAGLSPTQMLDHSGDQNSLLARATKYL